MLKHRRFGSVTSSSWPWQGCTKTNCSEQQKQDLLPGEAKMRQMVRGFKVCERHCAREGQIETVRSTDIASQRNHHVCPENRARVVKQSCKVIHEKLWTLRRNFRTSKTKSRVLKTQTKDEEQVQRTVCSKAISTPRVFEVAAGISTVFEDVWNRGMQLPGTVRSVLGNGQAWLARFSAEVEEGKPEGGQAAGSAFEEGANQVPSPVTPADWQSTHLDENIDDALDLDAERPTGFFSNSLGFFLTP